MTRRPHMRLLLEVERERERENLMILKCQMLETKTTSLKTIISPENWWLKDQIFFWRGPFSRTMLVFRGVEACCKKLPTNHDAVGIFSPSTTRWPSQNHAAHLRRPEICGLLRMSPWWSHSPWGFGMNPSKAYSLLEVKEVTRKWVE